MTSKIVDSRSYLQSLLIKSKKNLQKYQLDESSLKKKVLKDILLNSKSRLVGKFKDYLIFDDDTEFLKRFYNYKESSTRLIKIFDFYEENSKIFPNYIVLHQAKYIYKNIQRKQKLIDYLQYIEDKKEKEVETSRISKNKKLFNSLDYNCIMNQTNSMTLDQIFNDGNNSLDYLIQNITHAEKISNLKSKISQLSNYMFHEKEETVLNFFDEKPIQEKPNFKLNSLGKIHLRISEADILKSLAENSKENNKINTQKVISHKAGLSMPKLTINNNIINNITVINNNSGNRRESKNIIIYEPDLTSRPLKMIENNKRTRNYVNSNIIQNYDQDSNILFPTVGKTTENKKSGSKQSFLFSTQKINSFLSKNENSGKILTSRTNNSITKNLNDGLPDKNININFRTMDNKKPEKFKITDKPFAKELKVFTDSARKTFLKENLSSNQQKLQKTQESPTKIKNHQINFLGEAKKIKLVGTLKNVKIKSLYELDNKLIQKKFKLQK